MSWCFLHNQFVGAGCNGCKRDRAAGVRRAPVKLPDGKWSDGVNREHRIYSFESGRANGRRVTVMRPTYVDEPFWKHNKARGAVWAVVIGQRSKGWHPEFSDAIIAADKLARELA